MVWWQYLMLFFGGAFTANFVPHFVRGICGAPFPTPFAKPPGKGPSSPTLNVIWGLANLAVGYLLLRGGGLGFGDLVSTGVTFVGAALMALMLSKAFAPFNA